MAATAWDKDGLLEPQLVAALEATGQMFPHMDLLIQHYTRRDQRAIARNPLGRMSCDDTSLPRNRKGRTRGVNRMSKTIYRVEEFWETLYEWGLLTPHWTTYWVRRQSEGKPAPKVKAQPTKEPSDQPGSIAS